MALGTVNVSGVMQSDIEEVKQDIQYVSDLIGEEANKGGTVTEGTVMAKLNALIGVSSKGLKIKSVQHGYVHNLKTGEITINFVDISKSILISDVCSPYDASYARPFLGLYLKNSTQIATIGSTIYGACANWSVIEFE